MTTVRVTHYGVDGEGRNVTEAKRDAGRKIERAMTGTYSPRLLESRGTMIVLWRDPQGWHHNYIAHKGVPCEHAFQGYSSGDEDFHVAYASALQCLAQDTWDGAEMLPPCLEGVANLAELGRERDTAGRRLLGDFRSWRGFQLAYRYAKEHKPELPEHEWHRWACDHGHLFADKPAGCAMVEGGAA